MMVAGLHVTDLNLFDGTGEFLIAHVHQVRDLEETIDKVCVSRTRSYPLASLMFCSKF